MVQTKRRSGGLSERGRFWQRHIVAWRKTSLSQAQYCRRHDLSAAAFGWWKRQLGAVGFGPKKPKATTRSSKPKCRGAAGDFLEVALPDNGGTLELALSSGRTLRFDAGIRPESLTTILSVFRELELC
jgi:hypothetical protein